MAKEDWKWVLKSRKWGEEWRRAGKGVGLERKAREEERGEVRRMEKPMREMADYSGEKGEDDDVDDDEEFDLFGLWIVWIIINRMPKK